MSEHIGGFSLHTDILLPNTASGMLWSVRSAEIERSASKFPVLSESLTLASLLPVCPGVLEFLVHDGN
jgi:hypothetical protein